MMLIVVTELGVDVGAMTFGRPDSLLSHSLAGGLGWGVPAALGAKLAAPDRLVIAAVGDGSYMFANPDRLPSSCRSPGYPAANPGLQQ